MKNKEKSGQNQSQRTTGNSCLLDYVRSKELKTYYSYFAKDARARHFKNIRAVFGDVEIL